MQCLTKGEVNGHPTIVSKRRAIVPVRFWRNLAEAFALGILVSIGGCSKPGSSETQTSPRVPPPVLESPSPRQSPRDLATRIESHPQQPTSEPPLAAPLPTALPPPLPENPRVLQQRYFAATTAPDERSEIIRALGAVGTTEAAEVLRFIFGAEKRLELRMEVLEVAGDLDPERNREGKLAILTLAVAPVQPQLLRLNALQVLGEMDDRRVLPLLRQLTSDRDAMIRNDAAEIVESLEQ